MDISVIIKIFLGALMVLALILYIAETARRKRGGSDEPVVIAKGSCATCTGNDPKCEQECMMEAATKEIEYFDDEELDAFKGRPADTYTDEEVTKFSYIFETMRPDEVAGWCRSLTLRGISLPNQLKDDVFMMIDDK
jgi:hypothetical protein